MSFSDEISKIHAIKARHPSDSTREIRAEAGSDLISQFASLRRTTKLYEYCFLIAGFRPPVNNIGYHEKMSGHSYSWPGMCSTHAVFKGLNRPFKEEGGDEDVFAYILNPEYTYEYTPSMVCVAKLVASPLNCVFVVYVKLIDDDSAEILNWEWVACADDMKPIDHETRYTEEC